MGNASTDTLTITSTIISNLIFTDATYDIGASGATRPRDFFLSRNATVGGTLAVTGVATLSASTIALRGVTYTLPSADGVANAVLTTNGSATLSWAGAVPLGLAPGGRLTLTTAVPVTTSDVTGATTIYYTPYTSRYIELYSGSAWVGFTFSEISLALGTLTATLPYDVFIYNNSGTLTLEFTAWTNGTTRATALARQDGILVKTGALTRRYLGTFYTTSTTETEDSEAKRLLYNYYNRVDRLWRRVETTDSWAYTTDTLRQANGNTANQLEAMIGVVEDAICFHLTTTSSNSSANVLRTVNIGRDSTSVATAGIFVGSARIVGIADAGTKYHTYTTFAEIPPLGYHYWAWLEKSEATGTTTWIGDDGGTVVYVSGMTGLIRI